MKARVAIFNKNGRESIWWEHLKKVKKISERKINSRSRAINPEGSRRSAKGRKRSSSGSSNSQGSIGGSSSSSHRNKRKMHYKNSSYGKFKKEKPPTFDGEIKSGQEVESWLLGMKNYFQVQDNSGNMKAMVAIFNMNDRAYIW